MMNMFDDVAYWTLLLGFVDVVLAGTVTVHAVLWKRDVRAVIGWVGLAWLAPILGACAYYFFGINRVHRRSLETNLQNWWDQPRQVELDDEELAESDRLREVHPGFHGLIRLGDYITARRIMPGNCVDPLRNGDEAFPAMLGAIHSAQRSVTLQTYLFDSDLAGEMFFEALVDADRRGVEVRILIDDVGSRYSRPNMAERLRRAGMQVGRFMPTRIPRLPHYANLRNHRKILVVDGRIGFTGGTNIRYGHCLNDNPPYPAACLHFRMLGPVVEQLQEVFAIDWAFVTGERLEGPLWFAATHHAGTVWARGIADGPDEDFEKLSDLMAGALGVATRRVRIVTPYFLPNAAMIQALNLAAMRGVAVEIYMPEQNNIPLVKWASTAQLWQNVSKGCHAFSVQGPFDHTKLMVVDEVWTLIGSTNWDPRSLRLNFEFNVECYDAELAAGMHALIDEKAANAREIQLDELDARSFPTRLRDGLSRLLMPYL